MDFFVTDSDWNDLDVIEPISIDMGIGEENTLDIEMPLKSPLEYRSLVYAPGTEFGGIIDSRGIKTREGTITYSGRTWQGILESQVVPPPPGKTHYTVSGDANRVLSDLIGYLGVGDLFTASSAVSGIHIEHTFDRWSMGYTALRKMLYSHGAKLMVRYTHKVELSAERIKDHSDEIDSLTTHLEIDSHSRPINHLVCLGKGEGLDRTVINLYADSNGRVKVNGQLVEQEFYGVDKRTEIYDYPNAEYDDLLERGLEKLEEYQQASQIGVFLDDEVYDIDDTVAAYETLTGTYGTARVTEKILRVDDQGFTDIEMKSGTLVLKAPPSAESTGGGNMTYIQDLDPSELQSVIAGDTWIKPTTRQSYVYKEA